ncbi:hypothetical protein C0971_02385 [Bacillus methanolicus]|nr:hypothetical protein C0971_02385 [Bacillus methanolicus]
MSQKELFTNLRKGGRIIRLVRRNQNLNSSGSFSLLILSKKALLIREELNHFLFLKFFLQKITLPILKGLAQKYK